MFWGTFYSAFLDKQLTHSDPVSITMDITCQPPFLTSGAFHNGQKWSKNGGSRPFQSRAEVLRSHIAFMPL